jgi:hypothetical protein
MAFDRFKFYDKVRHNPFNGHLNQGQVDGMEALLDEALSTGVDYRWTAYILGTTFHETARTMQPIEEYGKGAGRPYGVPDPITGKKYYGRGFVQLTWKKNYKKLGDELGVDLVNHPERALDLKIATDIIYVGMSKGLFTGKMLSQYFNSTTSDWYNARRIVNGLDKAQAIANYSRAFYSAILIAAGNTGRSGPFRGEEETEPDYVEMEIAAILEM